MVRNTHSQEKQIRRGYFSYEKIEKGVYELLETSCTDDWLLNTEVYTVTVDNEGKVSITGLSQDQDGRYLVADRSRIYGELEFEKTESGDRGSNQRSRLSPDRYF